MLRIHVDPDAPASPSRQIVEQMLAAIAAGVLAAGDRLPSVRTLAVDALIHPNTVAKAYRELELLGAVEGRNGSGVFVQAGGPKVARERVRGATRAAFGRAAREALAAGHDVDALRKEFEAAVRAAERERQTT